MFYSCTLIKKSKVRACWFKLKRLKISFQAHSLPLRADCTLGPAIERANVLEVVKKSLKIDKLFSTFEIKDFEMLISFWLLSYSFTLH